MGDKKVIFTISLNDLLSKGLVTSKQAADALNTSMSKGGKSASGAKESFGELNRVFAQFTAANLAASAIGSVVSGIESFISESGKAYREAEKNSAMLKYAVTELSGGTKAEFEDLEATAKSSLKNLWTKSDVEAAVTPLIEEYGMTASAVKKLIPLIGTFASMSNKSLPEAAMSIAKATRGMGRDFKAMGVDISHSYDESKNLANIETFLGSKIGVMGEYANTAAGQLQSMNAELEEQKEELGRASTAWDLWLTKIETKIATGFTGLFSPETLAFSDAMKEVDKVVNQNLSNFHKVIGYEKATSGERGATGMSEAGNKAEIASHRLAITAYQEQINELKQKNPILEGVNTLHEYSTAFGYLDRNINKVIYNHSAQDKLRVLLEGKEAETETWQKMLDIQYGDNSEGKGFYNTPGEKGEPIETTPKINEVHGNAPTNINITIGDLVKEFNIETTNISTNDYGKIKELVAQALISAVNDSSLIPTH